jgi:hypothetical protein
MTLFIAVICGSARNKRNRERNPRRNAPSTHAGWLFRNRDETSDPRFTRSVSNLDVICVVHIKLGYFFVKRPEHRVRFLDDPLGRR